MIQWGTFGFLWPWMLSGLLILPVLAWWFLKQQQAGIQALFAFSQLQFLQTLQSQRQVLALQRLIATLLLFALGAGIIGLAQPVWTTKIVSRHTQLMLVLDISLSMAATDMTPSRLEAAKAAAIEFTRDLPDDVLLGLELFAGNTYLVTPPTRHHDTVMQYLNSLQPSDLRPGTAIGDALTTAAHGLEMTENTASQKPSINNPAGSIILLTDGETNLGLAPQAALEGIKRRHIIVSTVGVGGEGAYVQGDIYTRLDEAALQEIAQATGGNYYRAKSLTDFKAIYRHIAQHTLGFEEQPVSLMPLCLVLCVLSLLAALGVSIRYRRF